MVRPTLILMLLTLSISIASVAASPTTKSMHNENSSAISTQWLLSYEGNRTNIVRWDPRFPGLLRSGLSNVHVKWWGNHTLAATALEHLSGPDSPVYIELNRYVTLSAMVPHNGDQRGLLWVDTGAPKPTMIFVHMKEEWDDPDSTEMPASLELYVKDPELAANLPSVFIFSLHRWIKTEEGVTKVTSFTLINSQGQSTQLSMDILKTQ